MKTIPKRRRLLRALDRLGGAILIPLYVASVFVTDLYRELTTSAKVNLSPPDDQARAIKALGWEPSLGEEVAFCRRVPAAGVVWWSVGEVTWKGQHFEGAWVVGFPVGERYIVDVPNLHGGYSRVRVRHEDIFPRCLDRVR